MSSNARVCKHQLDQAKQLKAQEQSTSMYTIVFRFALETFADSIRKKKKKIFLLETFKFSLFSCS